MPTPPAFSFALPYSAGASVLSFSSSSILASAGAHGRPVHTPARADVLSATLPNGDTYSFSVGLNINQSQESPLTSANVVYTPMGTAAGKVASFAPVGEFPSVDISNTSDNYNNQPVTLSEGDGTVYDPSEFQMTMANGVVYDLKAGSSDTGGGLQWVKDRQGNVISFTSGGITETNAANQTVRSITTTRSGAGNLITRITDPDGNHTDYDNGSGRLDSYTDRDGNPTTYDYDAEGNLTGIHNAQGTLPLRNYYDASGRLLYTLDANNKEIQYTYNLSGNQETVQDRDGNQTKITYNPDGQVTQKQTYYTDLNNNSRWVTTQTSAFGDSNNPDKPTTITDALGHETDYQYDAAGDLLNQTQRSTNSTDPVLTTTTLYDGYGNPLKMVSPAHQGTAIVDTTNAFDPNTGNLTETLDAKGNPAVYFYASSAGTDYLTGTMDAAGHTTSMAYDNAGNLLTSTDANQVTTSFTYDANGNRSSQSVPVTLASGPTTLTTQYVYDDNGNLTKMIAPDGSSTQTIYNDLGKVDHTIDSGGRTTQYTYDDLGQLITTTYPDTSTTQTIYDANGQIIATKDQMGRWTGTAYDALGRTVHTGPLNTSTPVNTDGTLNWLTDTTTGLPIYTTTVYNDDGTVKQQIDEDGHTTSYTYDGYGRKLTETDGFGVTTATYSYDANGNQQTVTTPAPVGSNTAGGTVTTQYQYDEDSRLVKTIYPDNSFTQTDYNNVGQKIDTIDQDGRMTQFDYDPDGRLWHVTNPIATEVTTFGYDEVGNKIWQQDANGHTTHFAYDGTGRLVGKALPDGTRTESMTYNPDGTLATTTDYNGHVTTYGYDPQTGRRTSVSHDDGTGVSYTYNADGSKHTQTRVNAGGTVTETYSYDASRGFLTSVATQTASSAGTVTNTVSYNYDDAGNKLTMQDGSGTTHYSYDADNRLKTVIAPDGATTTYAYDQIGNRASVARPNGVTTTYAYNDLSRLVTLTNSAGPSFQYVLDAAGKRQQMIDSVNGTTTYGYDGDGRLVSEAGPGGTHSYYYDKVGNRVQEDSTAYTYDADDRNTAYSYDANGNVLNNGTLTMTYDEDNEVTSAGGNTYLYDADGTRVQATTTAGVTNYVVDTSAGLPVVVEERDDSNNLVADYVYGDDLIRMDRGGSAYYYIFDGSGSTRALTSSTGGVTDLWTYDAFGNATRSTTVTSGVYNPYLYDGQEQDNTGLYYLRARYYNPQDGRFLSQDPLNGSDDDPVSLHKYTYAGADPVNMWDLSGQEVSSVGVLVTMSIGAALGAATSAATSYARGQAITIGSIAEGAVAGAILAPAAVYIPLFGMGLAIYGLASSGELAEEVFSNPSSTIGQRFVAIGLVIASIYGAKAAGKQLFNALQNQEQTVSLLSDDDDQNALASGGCFVAGTPIALAGGQARQIERIKIGDLVQSRNSQSGETESKRVLRTTRRKVNLVVSLELADAQTGRQVEEITATLEHPFYVAGKGFVGAGRLGVGTHIVTQAGPELVVKKVIRRQFPQGVTVYNLTVDGDHTYFVGKLNGGAWVHNLPCEVSFSDQGRLQHMFDAHGGINHALDFDPTLTKWDTANGAKLVQVLQNFLADPDTMAIKGTYRGTMTGTHYYNAQSDLWVFVDDANNFHVGWKLYPSQIESLLSTGDVR